MKVTFQGETKTVCAWAKQFGISRGALGLRLKSGWDIRRAVTQKPSKFSKRKNLVGRRFGRLIVSVLSHVKHPGTVYWKCSCDCGKESVASTWDLCLGHTKSCGCLRHESRNKTHGMGDSTEYRIWCGMKSRCFNKRDVAFAHYGGRGISVCPRWRSSFEAFLADMGMRPSPNLSLDRIDNGGNYEPENCRWATRKQQLQNTRRSTFATYRGIRLPSSEWARVLRKSPGSVFSQHYRKGIGRDAALANTIARMRRLGCPVDALIDSL